MLRPIGLVELACAALLAFPKTGTLGAILVAGYFGGAIATHLRGGDLGIAVPLLLGVLAWSGLWLRDRRVRELLPLRPPISA
jgi:hypothetical protein